MSKSQKKSNLRYRVFPTEEQMDAIEENLKAYRRVYNLFLDIDRAATNTGKKHMSFPERCKMLPGIVAKESWLKTADSRALLVIGSVFI